MKPLPKAKPKPQMSEAEFADIEQTTVRWAEQRAGEGNWSVEWVLSAAFRHAASSGRTPLEILLRTWMWDLPEEQR